MNTNMPAGGGSASGGKKLLFIAIIGALILSSIGIGIKYQRRQERLRKAEEAKKLKAPEVNVTIIEGWNLEEIGSYLEKQGLVSKKDFLLTQKSYNSSAYDFLTSKPKTQGLEGFLFPDTYRVLKPETPGTTTAAQVIKRALDNFDLKLTEKMREDIKSSGLSLYEIVTLASIIEKETGRNVQTTAGKEQLQEERKMVAGVFYNRLNSGVALQSDATINYITNKNEPAVTLEDTQIDSPYNTYKYQGLPPGPICNPSLSSLIAAIYPTATDYFYFLHKQPSGEIVYSRTFEEHIENKNRYLK